MPKQTLALRSQQERKAARRNAGPLIDFRIAPATRKRYEVAVARYLSFLLAHARPWPQDCPEVDSTAAEFIQVLWEDGDPLSYATDMLSGLQFYAPPLKKNLPSSWQFITAWRKAELPARATPFLPRYAAAVAGYFAQTSPTTSLAILVGFHCLLRTGEILLLQWKHFELHVGHRVGVLVLPNTKSGNRTGTEESVVIDDVYLLELLVLHRSQSQPGDFLVAGTSGAFRKKLDEAVVNIPLPPGRWRPYSIRRGGATAHFREHGSLDATAIRGRWQHVRTCRIYINDAMTTLAELAEEPDHKNVRKWQCFLSQRLRQV